MHVDLTMPSYACMQEIAGLILQEQSPKRLYEIRGKLYELLVNCLPPELVLRRLVLELFRQGLHALPVAAWQVPGVAFNRQLDMIL